MHASSGKLVLALFLLSLVSPVGAQEKKEEVLPAPQIVVPPSGVNLLAPAPAPPGPRDVWQLYGVDQSGRFRPRVIYAPSGAYYLYNRQPFPWTTTRPLLYLRTIAN